MSRDRSVKSTCITFFSRRYSAHTITDVVQVLIEHGADVTAQDNNLSTPLHLASSEGNAEIARVLIENGADINARDGSHKTPLHLASFSGSVETVRHSLKHRVNVKAQDESHKTPLHLASSLVSAGNRVTP